MAVRHVPYWVDRVPVTRRKKYARLRGEAEAPVLVVGGGLTGCACAYSFAAAGVKTILLEADRIGHGATAADPGVVREDFDASFHGAVNAYGLRAARSMWQATHRASLDFAAALRRISARCDLEPSELLQFAPASASQAKLLRREYQERRDGGLEYGWATAANVLRETALEAGGAIRTRGASLDPYAACVALAVAAEERGAVVYEQSRVTRVRTARTHLEIATDAGTIRAEAIVIATGAPLAHLKGIRRHLEPRERYVVVTEPLPAAVRREVGGRAAAIQDGGSPPHLLRWLPGDRVLFAGGDQPPQDARTREKTLVQRTGQLMYELSLLYPAISGLQPAWSWDLAECATADGLPCIGVHRNFPRHLFALGGARHGCGVSWLAARLLLNRYRGESSPLDDQFGFTRLR